MERIYIYSISDYNSYINRRNQARAVESMQATLEAESRSKNEALRIRKKLEKDINELEAGVDTANRVRADMEKNAKRFQEQCREFQSLLEDERTKTQEAVESVSIVERRITSIQMESNEMRSAAEVAERGRKAAETELVETSDRVNEISSQMQSISSQKRKLESDVSAMNVDLEDMSGELRRADEQAKKAMIDSSRLADELRSEKDHASQVEKMRKVLEIQIREFTIRLDEAESKALKGGKGMIVKLETRVS